ncbi:hypothetical protein [Dinghuibacter silviterrae]|uniref:hypothetical protein n=1 Tax=Dinghuibacter silviterrae TaxID=1539049 RepID=UPI001063CD91|nr:hypothetical protein [Dinghuibacter silviterrae]
MKLLTFTFWTIVVSIAFTIFLNVHPSQVEHGFDWSVIRSTMEVLSGFMHLFCPMVIGYILWLFKEKRWIIWCSYAYPLFLILGILINIEWTRITGSWNLFGVAEGQMIRDIPMLLCSLAWLQVKNKVIAPVFRWLTGALWMAYILNSLFNIYYAMHHIPQYATRQIPLLFYTSVGLRVVVQLPLLFLITRTQQWITDNHLLEKEISQIG